MPWRRPPQAASFSILSAAALIAAATGLRDGEPPPGLSSSIDNTLTRDDAGCAGVRSTVWHPLSGIDYTGRLRITLPAQFGGAIALYIGDAIPLDVEAIDESGDPVPANAERLTTGPGVLLPPDYWLDDGTPEGAPPHVTRLQLDASGELTRTVTLSLGRRAPRVLARLIGYPPSVRVPVCADGIRAGEVYFATGWYGQEHDAAAGPVRWMRAKGALLLSSIDGRAVHVRARVAPSTSDEGVGVVLSVRVNDTFDLAPRGLRDGFQDLEWPIPETAWLAGTNELLFSVSRTSAVGTRELGLALASLDVR